MRKTTVPATVLVLAVTAVIAAACSSGSHPSSSTPVATTPLDQQDALTTESGSADLKAAPAPQRAAGGTAGAAGTAGTTASQTNARPNVLGDPGASAGRDLILTADLTVRVVNVSAAARQAETATDRVNGLIAREDLSVDPDHPERDSARMTLRVPVPSYDATLIALAKLGTQISAHRGVEDVTDKVVDTASRISTAKASIGRVRTLLHQATTLGEIVDLESELTKRQADLESLQRRLASLRKQVDLATIELSLVTPDSKAVTAAPDEDRDGFVGGLQAGWDAFTRSGKAVLEGVGAALPFALLLVVLAAAAVAFRRRVRPAHAPDLGPDLP
jgi:hypothetical protein